MNTYTHEDATSSWYGTVTAKLAANKLWPGVSPSDRTLKERDKVAKQMDKFTRFSWRGYDAYENFGMFIINDKRAGLSMYNGPSYSNKYVNPQFEGAAGILTGVSFSTQQIKFKVGVYWISANDYRALLSWLNPYEINDLTFDYDGYYRYLVKLNGIKDSTKYVVGKENGESMYYTEFDLTFDIQGTPCAYERNPFEWELDGSVVDTNCYNMLSEPNDYHDYTDLNTPMVVDITFDPNSQDSDSIRLVASASLNNSYTQKLFSLTLINLKQFSNNITITYDSESGLLYMTYDDTQNKLLSLLSTANGERIVQTMSINKFVLPSRLVEHISTLPGNFNIKITAYNENGGQYPISKVSIKSYGRTNII